MITHFVVIRTKSGENASKILEGLQTLKQIKCADSVSFGSPVASERPVVDDTFTAALCVQCKDSQTLSQYLNDPIHVKFAQDYLKKYQAKITVYDVQ